MSPRILLALLLLAACAGPSAHQTRAASQPEAVRPVVASTLGPDDPLAASNCGLPTAPGSPCTDVATEPEEKEVGDEHHQHRGAPMPAPVAPAPHPEKKNEEGHRHHQHGGKAAPQPAPPPALPIAAPATQKTADAPEAMVIDPVCKMKIDPTTAKGGTLKVNGAQYWFCSSSCKRTFLSQNPGAQ